MTARLSHCISVTRKAAPIHTSGYFTGPTARPLFHSGTGEPSRRVIRHTNEREGTSTGTYNGIVDDLLLPAGTVLHHETEVKRSRFLTEMARVSSPEEARRQIDARKSAMPDARHHCTAFTVAIPDSSPVLHSSDDGEPSGTAGRPMLEVLRGIPLLDTVAIVTRYFGGTLLGTGGLVRAYSDAVKECLEGAPLVERRVFPVWETLLPHADGGRYLSELDLAGLAATPEYLAEGVRARIVTPLADELAKLLARLSSGKLSVSRVGSAAVETPWGFVRGGSAVPQN